MAKINENYLKLQAGYLFPEIERRVNEYSRTNPEKKIIKMGIGDVTLPLIPSVVKAFQEGVDEMSKIKTFRGYGPYEGYRFLREAIVKNDYIDRGVKIDIDEVFISDGSKSDTGNIQEIFGIDNTIAITDPVYPVYVDTTIMAGRTGKMQKNGYFDGIIYMPCTEDNNFIPDLPESRADLIYLCFPNNPTGATPSKNDLKKWVDYAASNNSIILYDSAYEAFIQEKNIPHSIFEIEGARRVAIEFRSYSKTAGFTGTRCAYTVIPKELMAKTSKGDSYPLHSLWYRRQSTKFNGVSYPVQKAAYAVYSDSGKAEIRDVINYYMKNAGIIREQLLKLGFKVYGGINAPYAWVRTKENIDSWELFDKLLFEANIVATPGSGFGPSGEGFIRFSAFALRENVIEAMDRIKNIKL
ncbi:MAG: LL-diaminopimelate aminotransferase [Bacteroidales bacterium]|nr:MAG: LL-diaminopimelate aminotransferase [Bacteroidales bacterium]